MDKTRALIVDDSSVMRKIVERSLRQAGIEVEKVVEAAKGAKRWRRCRAMSSTPSCAVMDGLEFVRQLARVETAKGVDIVILGKAWTVTPVAQAAAPVATQDAETISGWRPQAHGRKVRRPSSTAVVPSRVRVRRE